MPRSIIRILTWFFDTVFLVPNNLWDAIPFFAYLAKDIGPIQKSVKNLKRKKPRKRNVSENIFARVFQIHTWWKFQFEKCKIERGIADKPFFSYLLDLYMEYQVVFLVISLDGWRVGQWNLYRWSPCVFSIVSTKFTLIGNDYFFTNLVWRSWCFRIFADISSRSSRKKQNLWIFVHFFFSIEKFCVGVSDSLFQVLIR